MKATALLTTITFVLSLRALFAAEEQTHVVTVTTNQGRVTERYRSANETATVSYAETTDDFPVAVASSTNEGHVFTCMLMFGQLAKAPRWNPERAVAPLSAKQAESIAAKRATLDLGLSLNQLPFGDPEDAWRAVDVTLKRMWLSTVHDYTWYYAIGLKRAIAGSSPGFPDAVVFVTMDGTAALYKETK